MKKLLGVFAAVWLAALLWSPPAEARCWWHGHRWHCTHYRHHHLVRGWEAYPYYRYRYPYYPYAYYPYYRPYTAYWCFPIWPFCGWG